MLNALYNPLTEEPAVALNPFERDCRVQAVVITGRDKDFAAGVDLAQREVGWDAGNFPN